MIKSKEKVYANRGVELDLTGPDGNAYALMAYVIEFGKQLGWTKEKVEGILEDMKSSDYEHLVQVFDSHFGFFVTLLR